MELNPSGIRFSGEIHTTASLKRLTYRVGESKEKAISLRSVAPTGTGFMFAFTIGIPPLEVGNPKPITVTAYLDNNTQVSQSANVGASFVLVDPNPPAEYGSLKVYHPEGASVVWSPNAGTRTQVEPGQLLISGLAPGTYSVTVSKTGYYTATQTVSVAANQTASLSFTLTPQPSTLNVYLPEGATLYLSPDLGTRVQVSPVQVRIDNLPAGSYALSASKPGFKAYSTSLSLAVGETKSVTVTLEPVVTPPPPPPPSPNRRYVLLAPQPTYKTMAPYITQAASRINSSPFDGVIVHSSPGWHFFDQVTSVQGWVSALTTSGVSKDRWAFIFNAAKPGPFRDTAAWAGVIQNARNLGQAMKQLGLKHLAFDNEGDSAQRIYQMWGTDGNSEADKPYAQARGKDIMTALCESVPNLTFLIYNGLMTGDPTTPKSSAELVGTADWPYYGDWFCNSAFIVGLIEGATPEALVVDGNGIYQYRTATQYQASYHFRRNQLSVISESLKAKYASNGRVAFGLYDKTFPLDGKHPMSADIAYQCFVNALPVTDWGLWLYSQIEADSGSPTERSDLLFGNGANEQAWLKRIAEARAAVGL